MIKPRTIRQTLIVLCRPYSRKFEQNPDLRYKRLAQDPIEQQNPSKLQDNPDDPYDVYLDMEMQKKLSEAPAERPSEKPNK